MESSNLKQSCLARTIKNCGLHICVLGTIGAGKTTLTKALEEVIKCEEGDCQAFYESVKDNKILPLYYKNPEKYAMTMQVYMLNKRFEQQLVIQDYCMAGKNCVQDSSVFGDTCFVEMLHKDGVFKDEEVDVYAELFQNISRYVMYPSVVVYLNCPPKVAIERIKKRGRKCETGIELSYLENLNREVKDLCNEMKRFTYVKEIDATDDLTEHEIKQEAYAIYCEAKKYREDPIITRMGL
jgi:deoxyadenosine/deoxycytidine kinase